MGDVVFRKVSKYFDTVCAVDEIDLKVEEGEFLALVGPSGCGKTTTLRMLAGLEFPNRGDIFVSGRRMNDIPAKDRNMAMVFQSYALYPHMTVYENMAFGLQVRKLPKVEIERRVNDAAALMGIEDFLNRKPRQLSGGQRQRVAVCRAIVRDPVLFLFDEPLSNLDAKLRVQARGEIRKLQRRLKTTSIYVTHDQTEAMTMGDRIVVMNEGKIHQIGPPVELYNKPVDRFVAGFLGSPAMNFIKGTAARNNDELILNVGSLQFPLLEYCREGSDYILGFRPEHIRLTGDEENFVSVMGIVELIEPLGSDSLVMADIGSTVVTIREDGQFNATVGETIKVRFDMKQSDLFDAETGMRIEA